MPTPSVITDSERTRTAWRVVGPQNNRGRGDAILMQTASYGYLDEVALGYCLDWGHYVAGMAPGTL